MVDSDGSIEIQTRLEDFQTVKMAFESKRIPLEQAEITMVAAVSIQIDHELAESFIKLIDHLEDLDDVQVVYSNAQLEDSHPES